MVDETNDRTQVHSVPSDSSSLEIQKMMKMLQEMQEKFSETPKPIVVENIDFVAPQEVSEMQQLNSELIDGLKSSGIGGRYSPDNLKIIETFLMRNRAAFNKLNFKGR